MSADFKYRIITPDGAFREGYCASLVIPTQEGMLGVLAHHSPLLAELRFGIITIEEDGKHAVYTNGGVFEMLNNTAVMVVGRADFVKDLSKTVNPEPLRKKRAALKEQKTRSEADRLEIARIDELLRLSGNE